ncbi:hypothetical protein MMC13_002750 [Lambiella insularis]|nr:hypothetical protein [Lambiella insularis]
MISLSRKLSAYRSQFFRWNLSRKDTVQEKIHALASTQELDYKGKGKAVPSHSRTAFPKGEHIYACGNKNYVDSTTSSNPHSSQTSNLYEQDLDLRELLSYLNTFLWPSNLNGPFDGDATIDAAIIQIACTLGKVLRARRQQPPLH